MQNIEFRVWHDEQKEFNYIKLEEYFGQTGLIDNWVGHSKGVWQQYTGLKDGYGNKIYVGDIIHVQYNHLGNVTVELKDGAYNIAKYNLLKCKVLGNIYQ